MFKTIAAALLFLSSGSAYAQSDVKPEPSDESISEEEKQAATDAKEEEERLRREEEESFDFDENDGRDENPGRAVSASEKEQENKKIKKKQVITGYPTRVIDRPLNLPSAMSQVHVEIPMNIKPFATGGFLEGHYGITSDVQIGLRYGMGAYSKAGFAVGKAIAVDAQYLVTENIAINMSLPLYLDPFAMGMSIGVPLNYIFFDKFSLKFGQDLLSFKLYEFIPSIENAIGNDLNVASLDDNTITQSWQGKAVLTFTYQQSDTLALAADFGTQFDDTEDAATTLLQVSALYVLKENLDLGARFGSSSLSSFVDTLGLSVFLNFRI